MILVKNFQKNHKGDPYVPKQRRKFQNFSDPKNTCVSRGNFMLRIDFQKPNFFSESGPGKHFQGSGIRAIDSPHKITPRNIKLPLEK